MAYYSFAQRILAGRPIQVFHDGKLRRDFTYIDDIVEGIVRLLPLAPDGSPTYRLLNIGNNQPVALGVFIATLEKLLDRKAIIEYLPLPAGDVLQTYADTTEIETLTGFKPATSLEDGLRQFVAWMPNAP
jgi:UDP-glucuronate 4-epimerase